ncbi:MAG: PKD domain-containing protein [Thermoplasmata archaeon]|nr:MAG: PKD domain-containing protein [Thermoplasmata archaeon]
MNRNPKFSGWFALLIGIGMLLSGLGTLPLLIGDNTQEIPLSGNNGIIYEEIKPATEPNLPERTGTRAGSQRIVLAELFTNWGCGPCTYANPAINDLLDVYNRSQLMMIAYHTLGPSFDDPFYWHNSPDNNDRVGYYGISTVPSMFFDGPPNVQHDFGNTYTYYKGYIDSELAVSSPLEITVDGYLYGTSGQVNVSVLFTDTLPGSNLKIRYGIVEDNKYAHGPNNEVRHRYVMRDMLTDPEQPLPPLSIGQTYSTARIFEVKPEWDEECLSIVVFVQNDDDGDVLQAGYYDFRPQKILVVDDDASGHPDGPEDYYHELMCEMGESFDGWALNEKGSPTYSDLSPYEVVIWQTSTEFTSTLTSSDQSAISDYLDYGTGSLFLIGQDIGADIGSTAFFSDYLHADFITTDTGDVSVKGIEDDPISDPFYGTSIPVRWTSPSEINPIGTATTIFKYTASNKNAAIRAGHDSDSRIVYFAFVYFEEDSSTSNKMTVMGKVLSWINIDVDYTLIRDAPQGTGNEVTQKVVEVGTSTTLWVACYNNRLGFVEDGDFTIWSEDSGGSLITITSPGSSTLIQAGMDGGIVNLTADYLGLVIYADIWVPTVDFINMTNTPGGVELTTVLMGANQYVTAYASGFNSTTGYVKLIDVDWDESAGLGVLSNDSGTSTTFTSGVTGGLTTITGQNLSLVNSFEVNISTAKVDYIQIRDSPDNGGSIVTSITLDVGESDKLYAAAFNLSAGYLGDYITTTWSESSTGSVITVSPDGGFTTVTAQLIGGVSTITADNDGAQNFTTVSVNAPTTDYILIRDAPYGGGKNLCDIANYPSYPVGHTTEFYGAKYNVTADYIGAVPTSSTWSSGNSNLVGYTTPGNSSTISCSSTLHGTTTITLNMPGHSASTQVMVLEPTVDFILIRDSPDGGGNAVSNPTYDVGDEDTYYAASYNDTAWYLEDVTVIWNCTDFNVCTITPQNESVKFQAIAIGSCKITARYNGVTYSTPIITVDDITPPTADCGSDDTIGEDTVYTFDATASNDNSEIILFEWDFGDGNSLSGTEQTPTNIYYVPGIYTVTLVVTDTGGNTDYDSITITVLDVTYPVAVVSLPEYAEEKAPCTLDGSSSYDNVDIVSYKWVLGDGTQYYGLYDTISHIFQEPGNYTVNLTVKDSYGYEHTTSTYLPVLDVTPPSQPKGLRITQVETGGVLVISWDANLDIDFDHYELFCAKGNGSFDKIADIDAGITAFTHENLENGQVYTYYLIAVDTSHNPSPPSIEVEGIPDLDTDGDGIFNLEDYDDDNDGLSDNEEVRRGLDPLDSDSDDDSHGDGDDAFPKDPKEWKDSDGDGYGDAFGDTFPRDPDEWKDSDGDGIGDNSDDFQDLDNTMVWMIIIIVIIVVLVVVLLAVRQFTKKGRGPQPPVAGPQKSTAPPIAKPLESDTSPKTEPTKPAPQPKAEPAKPGEPPKAKPDAEPGKTPPKSRPPPPRKKR